jgi:cell division protein FtsW
VEKVSRGQIDYFLLVIIILLFGVGMAILFSASYNHAERLGKNPHYFFNKQVIWLILGGFIAYGVSRAPLDLIRKCIPFILISAFFISLLPFVPGLGKDINGARRWIFFFDYSFQPSEYVKLALILYLASILSKKEKRLDEPVNTLLPPLIIVSLFVGVVFLQNDLSTAAFIFFIAISLLYIAKIKLIYFFYMATVVLPIGIIILFTKTYWVEKIMTFLDPSRNPEGTGYQILTSRISLASGGFWGKGMGLGVRKQHMPEADSDFIFSVAGEEMGFIGLFFIIVLFVLFALRGFMIAFKSRDSFSFFLAFGITSTILIQALLNMFVVAGLMPTTGIPLPFFSNGGSSIVITLIMCGLLVNLSRTTSAAEGARYG